MGIYSFIIILMPLGSVVNTFLSLMILVICVRDTFFASLFCLLGQGVIDFIDIFKKSAFGFVDSFLKYHLFLLSLLPFL